MPQLQVPGNISFYMAIQIELSPTADKGDGTSLPAISIRSFPSHPACGEGVSGEGGQSVICSISIKAVSAIYLIPVCYQLIGN